MYIHKHKHIQCHWIYQEHIFKTAILIYFKSRDIWGNCHKNYLSPSSYRTFPRASVMDWLIQWQVTLTSFGLGSFPMAILKQHLNALFIGPPPALWDSQDSTVAITILRQGLILRETHRLSLSICFSLSFVKFRHTQGKQMKVQLGKYFSLHSFLSVPPGPKYYRSELHPLSS